MPLLNFLFFLSFLKLISQTGNPFVLETFPCREAYRLCADAGDSFPSYVFTIDIKHISMSAVIRTLQLALLSEILPFHQSDWRIQ